MTTDFRALCIELLRGLDENRHPEVRYPGHLRLVMAAARAALAEPEPEVVDPTDEEIMGLMSQQMHEDLAAAVRAMAEQEGIDSTFAKGVMRIMLNRHVVDLARAVLARWGRPAPGQAVEALTARPLMEQVAALGDRIGEQTVGQVRTLADRAAELDGTQPSSENV